MVATSTPELQRIRSDSEEKAKRREESKQPRPTKRCNKALFTKRHDGVEKSTTSTATDNRMTKSDTKNRPKEKKTYDAKAAKDKKRQQRLHSSHAGLRNTNSSKGLPKVTRIKKKQDDTTRIPRQKVQLSIRKPIWMSQQEQQLATNDLISTELTVAERSGVGLAMETAAEVTVNSSEDPQQDQQVATHDLISTEPTVAYGSGVGLAMEFAANDHMDVLSVVEQHDKHNVVDGVSMFYGHTNSKCRPKPTRKTSSLSEESGKDSVTKKRRVICRPSRFSD
jgi:hypothetical protein